MTQPSNESNASRTCSDCGHQYAPDLTSGLGDGCPKCLASFMQEMEPATADPGHDLKPGDVIGGAEILDYLGRGGMGTVYKGRQTKLGRTVAVKILDPKLAESAEFTARFDREAKALAALNHPNIVQIYDYGEENGRFFLIMEFVDGVSLRQMLNTGGVTPEAAMRYVPQMCDALEYAHDKGVIHRDIKPENILVDRSGNLKIADFGIAKMQGDAGDEQLWMTAADQVIGTANYMAPEQRRHLPGLDHRADIFSLGVVFYEMLTGELPLGRFPTPSQRVKVEVSLDEVVLKALEQDPVLRYQHASEVKQALSSPPATPKPTARPGGFPTMAIWAASLMLPGFFALWNIIRSYDDHWMRESGNHVLSEVWQYVLMPMTLLLALVGTVMGWGCLARIRNQGTSGSPRGGWLAAICAFLYPAAGVLCFLYSMTEYLYHGYGRAAMWPSSILSLIAIVPGIPVLILKVRRYLRSETHRSPVRGAMIAIAVMVLSLIASTLNSLEKRKAAYAFNRLEAVMDYATLDYSPQLPDMPIKIPPTDQDEHNAYIVRGAIRDEIVERILESKSPGFYPALHTDFKILYQNHYGDMYLSLLAFRSHGAVAFTPGGQGVSSPRFVAWIMPDRKNISFIGEKGYWSKPLFDFAHEPSGTVFVNSLKVTNEKAYAPRLVVRYEFPVGYDVEQSPERQEAREMVKAMAGVEADRVYELTLLPQGEKPSGFDTLDFYFKPGKAWQQGTDVGPRIWAKKN